MTRLAIAALFLQGVGLYVLDRALLAVLTRMVR